MYRDILKDTAKVRDLDSAVYYTLLSTPTLSSLRLGSEPDEMRSVMRIPSGSDHQITYYQLDV